MSWCVDKKEIHWKLSDHTITESIIGKGKLNSPPWFAVAYTSVSTCNMSQNAFEVYVKLMLVLLFLQFVLISFLATGLIQGICNSRVSYREKWEEQFCLTPVQFKEKFTGKQEAGLYSKQDDLFYILEYVLVIE